MKKPESELLRFVVPVALSMGLGVYTYLELFKEQFIIVQFVPFGVFDKILSGVTSIIIISVTYIIIINWILDNYIKG